jgi:hypothetical protein
MTATTSTTYKFIAIFTLSIFICNKTVAQIPHTEIYKKYYQTDSTIHKAAVLILYANKTFINYGTLNDQYNTAHYVWFDYGNWSMKNSEILCNSNEKAYDRTKIINEIKFEYKERSDFELYNGYYDYVKQPYKNYSLIVIKNKAIDLNKKIEYNDLQQNELISSNQ